MTAFQIVAVACLFAIGAQAMTTRHGYHKEIKLDQKHVQFTMDGLDIYGTDKVICEKDLNHHYYHHKVSHAVKKFLDWIDSKGQQPANEQRTVDIKELAAFMEKETVIIAVHECTFIRSQSLGSMCLADQILTYILHAIPHKIADALFKLIERPDDKDEVIDFDEMIAYLNSINAASDLTYDNDDVKNMMIEIGGSDSKIDAKEWREYVAQEELHDDFRICRTKLVQESCEVDYNHGCMVKEMLEFARNRWTEMDIEDTFHVFDCDTNGFITVDEIKKVYPDTDEFFTARFVKMMDKKHPADGKISYAEFRLFARDHWVKIEMERDCSSKKKTQKDEVTCYIGKIKQLVLEKYSRIWLSTPDLDMAITFEDLDHNDNGRIEKEEDLIKQEGWDAVTAQNFINEMDGPDVNTHVSLEEFNEAVDEPHMIYGMGDCMDNVLDDKPKRPNCYEGEIKDIMTGIMDEATVKAFFNYYDANNCGRITKDEVKAKGVADEDVDNFMQEMGMGDETVNIREFSWYVKQQRITSMFNEKQCGSNTGDLHNTMTEYHEKVFTEYDTQETFKRLDTNHDFELKASNCNGHPLPKQKSLLERIDKPDEFADSVNFFEFWIYLNTPMGSPRKTILEELCTKPLEKQSEEMQCYEDHFWEMQ